MKESSRRDARVARVNILAGLVGAGPASRSKRSDGMSQLSRLGSSLERFDGVSMVWLESDVNRPMAWFAVARLLFVAAVAYAAAALRPLGIGSAANVAFALALAVLVLLFENRLRETALTRVLGALIGCAIGLTLARTIASGLFWTDSGDRRIEFLHSFALIVLPYLGLVLGAEHGEWLDPPRLVSLFRPTAPLRHHKILDTSVIIDGRIADVCETGFIDGMLVVPQFVLKELQLIADSSDSLKRNRGRRGLDILQRIQKMSGIDVQISDVDFPEVREVDLKLIELARTLKGKIVTNDFNLNKVAQLRGVEVLNVNELTNSLKPVVLPGESMKVFILKEGKEYNQGVAYLDDGTMVVVDNARRLIGKTIDIVVTSVLQTTAGKMIFGRFIDPAMPAAVGQSVAAERDRVRSTSGAASQRT
jgi:uncharacterized protein YacL